MPRENKEVRYKQGRMLSGSVPEVEYACYKTNHGNVCVKYTRKKGDKMRLIEKVSYNEYLRNIGDDK